MQKTVNLDHRKAKKQARKNGAGAAVSEQQNGAGFVWESDVGRVGMVREAGNRALEVGGKHCAVHSVSNVGVTGME
nr:hypothetical protein [Tanacetum cinerariifolium]